MSYVVRKMIRYIPHFALIAAMLVPFASSATTVKALSFAINEASGSGDKTPIQNYMGQNAVDFGVFDYAKASHYFITNNFTSEGRNFKVSYYKNANVDFKYVIYDSDKYELVNVPVDDKYSNNITGVFEDEYGDQFALISLRGSYSASSVKTYIDGIAAKYPTAKLIVTYNARVGDSNAESAEDLNASLLDTSSGPGMTYLGRTDVDETPIGGVYMYPTTVPLSYSVVLVPKSIGTKYNGTLATLEFPTKHKVIFNDWDGTGLQTNVVVSGGSVTPPTPVREGYAFIGWDHDASEFDAVTESFTATAQYDEPVLTVMGIPENLGTADPAYGITTEIAADDSFTASVVLPDAEPDATERFACAGYTHYQITDFAEGTRVVRQEGTSDSFTYVHYWRDELVWHFTNEWLVTASASVGGYVSATETWARNGTAVSLTAIPAEGYDFWRWEGDTEGIVNISDTTISPTITSARTLFAIFTPTGVADPSVQYVSTGGDDGNNGYSQNACKLTIQAAIDTLVLSPGYGTVHVAAGTYQITSGIVITNAIAVIGETGDPENVIVRNTKTGNKDQVIVFSLSHPDAFVANITAEKGRRNAPSAPHGANLSIQEAGGTVSNCILRGAVSAGNYSRGAGAWLNSDNALLTHCVITNNSASGSGYQSTATGGVPIYGGIFVHVERGTVANCLIANNHDSGGTGAASQEKQAWSCGVTLRTSGRLVNCTVVTNEARYTAGVYLYPNSYATNVVVAGCVNRCTWYNGGETPIFTEIGFKGTLANVSHCASDGGEALDETCIAGTAAEFFADYENHDYRLHKDSPLLNKGVCYDGIAAVDLFGNPRVQGSSVDIGAYESSSHGLYIIVR